MSAALMAGGAQQLVREGLFPTLIYHVDLVEGPAINADLLPLLHRWQALDPAGLVRSNVRQVGSWHSRVDLHQREELAPLVKRILGAAQAVFEAQGFDPAQPPTVSTL